MLPCLIGYNTLDILEGRAVHAWYCLNMHMFLFLVGVSQSLLWDNRDAGSCCLAATVCRSVSAHTPPVQQRHSHPILRILLKNSNSMRWAFSLSTPGMCPGEIMEWSSLPTQRFLVCTVPLEVYHLQYSRSQQRQIQKASHIYKQQHCLVFYLEL